MNRSVNKPNPYSTFAKDLISLERENLDLRNSLDREKARSKAALNKLIREHAKERKELNKQIKAMLSELDEAYSEIDRQDEEIINLKTNKHV